MQRERERLSVTVCRNAEREIISDSVQKCRERERERSSVTVFRETEREIISDSVQKCRERDYQ